MKRSPIPFTIRPALLEDLDHCQKLDASYICQEVWQMQFDTTGSQGAAVSFRATRLPRTVKVRYPRNKAELRGNWHQQDCFLVATQEERQLDLRLAQARLTERIIGYINIHEQRWQRAGWVQNLVIDVPFRKQGIGTALLQAAAQWAKAEGLERLFLETTTKNNAAIYFFLHHGAEFCGFNEKYYTNGEIAIFFEYRL